MAIEEFEKEPLTNRQKNYLRMRSLMDYGMGLLWASMGIFLIFIKQFNTGLEAVYDPAMKVFGGICLVYGGFRIFRGYKKNYYTE